MSDIAKDGVLPATSAVISSGHVAVVAVDTRLAPTVLSLLASGRMTATRGTVSIEGNASDIRAAVALVDTPDISEPDPGLRLRTVVAEELLLARLPHRRRDVARVLRDVGAEHLASTRMESVPSNIRLALLCALAAARPGVEALVLTSPDRHGGSAREWREIADRWAARGYAVLVVTGRAAASAYVSRPDAALIARASARGQSRNGTPSTGRRAAPLHYVESSRP